jgi:hypothetical protein
VEDRVRQRSKAVEEIDFRSSGEDETRPERFGIGMGAEKRGLDPLESNSDARRFQSGDGF